MAHHREKFGEPAISAEIDRRGFFGAMQRLPSGRVSNAVREKPKQAMHNVLQGHRRATVEPVTGIPNDAHMRSQLKY